MSMKSLSMGISGLQGEMEGDVVPREERERRKEEKKRTDIFFPSCTGQAENGLAGSDCCKGGEKMEELTKVTMELPHKSDPLQVK
jgi:hypothetical protein